MLRASAGVVLGSFVFGAGLIAMQSGVTGGVRAAGSRVEKRSSAEGGRIRRSLAPIAVGEVLAAAGHTIETHICVGGPYGLTWHVTRQHSGYASISGTEPHAAQIYRGTIRLLPHSPLRFIALSAWGQARIKIGDFHPYAVVYWPRGRPVWLILLNSPALRAGSAVKVVCQR